MERVRWEGKDGCGRRSWQRNGGKGKWIRKGRESVCVHWTRSSAHDVCACHHGEQWFALPVPTSFHRAPSGKPGPHAFNPTVQPAANASLRTRRNCKGSGCSLRSSSHNRTAGLLHPGNQSVRVCSMHALVRACMGQPHLIPIGRSPSGGNATAQKHPILQQ